MQSPPPLPVELNRLKTIKRRWMIGLWVGIIISMGPIWGLLGTILGMMQTFEELAIPGTGDAEELSGGISFVLRTTEIGLLIYPLGLLILYLWVRGSQRTNNAIRALREMLLREHG